MDFLQNIDSQLIIWLAIGVLVVVGVLVVNNKMRRVAAFGGRAVIGAACIAAVNFVLGSLGMAAAVGVNVLTMAVAAFLGIPGIMMLYGLTFIL